MDQRFQPTAETASKTVIETLKEQYCFYRQKYVVMKENYTKTTDHYFTDRVLESHLSGNYAVGVFAGEKATRFISFDVDVGGKAAVRKVVDVLAEMGFPREKIYISTSGKKGYHVDMFFEPYIYNEKARNIYDIVIWRTQLDPKKVEFRPTHTQAIKLPLGIHQKTGNRCWFVDPVKLEPIEDMEYVCLMERIDAEIVPDILRKWNKKHWNELYADMICDGIGHEDIKPAYDYRRREAYFETHKLTEQNTRHDMMVRIATDIRYCGATASQIVKFLTGWYYKQDQKYIESTEDEVKEDIREIAEWAAENVPVVRNDVPPKDNAPIVFNREEIEYILKAPTSAARKVALLIWTYCKMYGATRISYARIAETVGCVEATAKTAVNELIRKHIINKKSGGLHINNGKMIRKSNTYFIPARHSAGSEQYAYREPYDKTKFDHFYYSMLGGLCADEYLAQYLTKPELECVKRIREGRDNEESGIHDGVEAG